MPRGTLYLIPTGLGSTSAAKLLPVSTLEAARRTTYFIAENAKTARAFLKDIAHPQPLQSLTIEVLDEHTPAARAATLLEPLESGTDAGLISEAGCPAVADPGAV